MSPTRVSADVVAVGELRPAPVPVVRPAPAAVSQESWPAYRLDAATEASLYPAEQVKRMGRGQAMALQAVRLALKNCDPPPERGSTTAVVVGSAWSEEDDEIRFLENIIKFGEKGAKPLLFVNSVHNALASQLALQFGWQGENQTFNHGALSFETALWQALRLLGAGRARRAVVCGAEALAELQQIHGHLLGHFHTDPAPLAPLSKESAGRLTLPGEGAAVLVLAPCGAAPARIARIAHVKACGQIRRPAVLDAAEELRFVDRALQEAEVSHEQLGLVLLGANGDAALDEIYRTVADTLRAKASSAAVGVYRHLTGDFAPASALGLALAVRAIAKKAVPDEIRLVAGTGSAPRSALVYHLTNEGYHSAIVVTA